MAREADMGLNLRQELQRHQDASGASTEDLINVLCGFITMLDDRGHIPHDVAIFDYVVESFEGLGMNPRVLPPTPWEDPRFTAEDKDVIIQMLMEEVGDCIKDIAFEQAEGEPMVELVSYVCDNVDELVDILKKVGEVGGEFLQVHDDDGEYAEQLNFAVRMKLIINTDEVYITELGKEFIERNS
jgi:hypothetical protein